MPTLPDRDLTLSELTAALRAQTRLNASLLERLDALESNSTEANETDHRHDESGNMIPPRRTKPTGERYNGASIII